VELDGTRALLALAETGTVFQAARRLDISRPTLRRRVEALGREVGEDLVTSVDGRTVLTPAGRLYAAAAPGLIRAYEGLRQRVLEDKGLPRGILRVASPPGAARPLTRALLLEMLDQWPGLCFDLQASIDPIALLDSTPGGPEPVDLALTTTLPPSGDLMARRLGTVGIGLYASAAYLKQRGIPQTVAELAEHDLLQVSLPPFGSRWPLATGGSVELAPRVASNDGGLILEMVQADRGIALLPDILANSLQPVLPERVHRELPVIAVVAPARARLQRVQVFLAATQALLARTATT
jgi:DNA-binding transcriptional LysR family regulator